MISDGEALSDGLSDFSRIDDRSWDSEADDESTENERSTLLPQRRRASHSQTRAEQRLATRERRQRKRQAQWNDLSKRLGYYVPITSWARNYNREAFLGDLLASLTLTFVLIPQALSYATSLAHVSPMAGIAASVVPTLVYSILGSSSTLSMGPEAALSLIIGESITRTLSAEKHAHGKLSKETIAQITVSQLTSISFVTGIVTFAIGILRFGFLDVVLSKALLAGFMLGIAVVIAIEQSIPILGLKGLMESLPYTPSTSLEKLAFVLEHFYQAHLLTVCISLICLAILFSVTALKNTLPRSSKFRLIPEIFILAAIMTILSDMWNWNERGVETLSNIGSLDLHFELALPWTLRPNYLRSSISTGVVVAIMGILDNTLASKDIASRTHVPISLNRELVGVGAANLLASFWKGTMPAFGGVARSRLAEISGASTQMIGIITPIFVYIVGAYFLNDLGYLPMAVLACVIVRVIYGIANDMIPVVLKFYRLGGYTELLQMAMTLTLTVTLGLEAGMLVSLALSMGLCIKHSASMRVQILGRIPDTNVYDIIDDENDAWEEIPGILIAKLQDPALTFANAQSLFARLQRLERYGPHHAHPSSDRTRQSASTIIVDIGDVKTIDATALLILQEIFKIYTEQGVRLMLAHVNAQARARITKSGIVPGKVVDSLLFTSVHDAIKTARQESRVTTDV